jgi:hypothetical protein
VDAEQRAPADRQDLVSSVPKYAPINRLLESLAYDPALIYLQAAEEEEAEMIARARGEDCARRGQPVRARGEGAPVCASGCANTWPARNIGCPCLC